MRTTGAEIAAATGALTLAEGSSEPPRRAVIDSSAVGPGDLFFGLHGEKRDGGEFAADAVEAGAWGVVVGPEHAAALFESRRGVRNRSIRPVSHTAEIRGPDGPAWIFAAADPLAALQALARANRRALGARVLGVTGSVGKTSVKDIARTLLPGRVHANAQNFNTEIGLPLTILEAPDDSEILVLEMAMRGAGQIAELAVIAEPDVAIITNVGPVHVELLGSVEAIAAAKAEVIDALPVEGTVVAPARAGELEPHLARAPRLLRFGPGGDIEAVEAQVADGVTEALVRTPAGEARFAFPFVETYNLANALAAIAAGVALGADPEEMAVRAVDIGFSRFRGERIELGDGIVLVNDCYNANPVSMRAALDHLATLAAPRSVAVLGQMGELGPDGPDFHREIGTHARAAGIDLVVGVGAAAREYDPDELVADPGEAAEWLDAHLEPGDAVLIKGSRSVGMETIAADLRAVPGRHQAPPGPHQGAPGRGTGGQSISDSRAPRRSRGGAA
ncbi:MAG TPA: UDP-N-acetylmuramoyl-tripeptide--D-alanyl-D-alanine ligase [Solirubrobacterales bacterium]|nr:UDP-N-acetylmuramoyl-tripeptide--D-alanyl-D-alanine ligase [Solirubrobacterales bacterium]